MRRKIEGGLFVIRRPFKAIGILHNVGEVVEDPTTFKLFRSRLSDRDIIELVPGQDKVNIAWLDYLVSRTTQPIDPRVYAFCNVSTQKMPEPSASVTPESTNKPLEITKVGTANSTDKVDTVKIVIKPLSQAK